MPTKYANYLNLINFFTVVGKDKLLSRQLGEG